MINFFPIKDIRKLKNLGKYILPMCFILLAILYAGTKPMGRNATRANVENTESAEERKEGIDVERGEGVAGIAEIEGVTNLFSITAFQVTTPNQTLSFNLSWQTNLFDFTSSRNVDLFMSTNLLGAWYWMNRYELPSYTNECSLCISTNSIAADIIDLYTNAFSKSAFFTFGFDIDSDSDGLTDAYERLVSKTSPISNDSDNDGLPDAWELQYGLNPIDASDAYHDNDNDGIPNLYEFIHGGNPNVPDDEHVPKIIAGRTDVPNGVATLREAFDLAEPYSIIEIADGVYSGTGWSGLCLPINYYEVTEMGDSGNPMFFVVNNEIILLNETFSYYIGPFLTYYRDEIQAEMDRSCPGYFLQYYDFSEYQKIKIERVR